MKEMRVLFLHKQNTKKVLKKQKNQSFVVLEAFQDDVFQFCAKTNKCHAKRMKGTLKQSKTQSSNKHNTRKICNQSTFQAIILSERMFQ
jgi:hypothetical protein